MNRNHQTSTHRDNNDSMKHLIRNNLFLLANYIKEHHLNSAFVF